MKYKLILHLILALVCLILIILTAQTNNHFKLREESEKRMPKPQPQERIPLQAIKEKAKPQEKSMPSCCSIASQHKLEELCPTNESVAVISDLGNGECNCTDYMMCKLVIVTAFSSNHFTESMDLFGSVYKELPQTKFIVYDLGLTTDQIHAIQSYCNVQEVREFKFDQYSNHTKDLRNYAWKPLIINEVSQEHELFLYCDASCRMSNKFIPFLPNILKFPIIAAARLTPYLSAIRCTHQGMLDYLGIKMSREEMVKILPKGFHAAVLLIWANDLFKDKILTPWVDCAMHMECISPKGATLGGCNFSIHPMSAYVGCHRFDQSAINVILIREFKSSLNTIFNDKGGISSKTVVWIDRNPTKHYNNSNSHECNILYQF